MRPLPLLARTLAALALAGACSRGASFPDRVAEVTLDGETTRYAVDGCLLDGTTAYVVGRADHGRTVQAVIGVEADGRTGVPPSTGITVDGPGPDDPSLAAFGAEAWHRRGQPGPRPGSIATAGIRGSRIQASGRAQPTAGDGRPVPGPPVALTFDARCDASDDVGAPPTPRGPHGRPAGPGTATR